MLRPKRSGKQDGSSFRDSSACRSANDDGGEELLRMTALASLSNDSSAGNVDPRIIDELQDLLPLLESFLDRDRKVSNCFTRKGKIVYTKMPSKESAAKKAIDQKGRHTSQSILTREPGILGENERNEDGGADSSSALSQRALEAKKDREEINALNNQLEDLRRKLSEKEEFLNAAEISKNRLTSAQEELNELQYQMREKDSLLKAFERRLSDAKVKLAEKLAVLEKIQWEAMTSNNQVEKLQEDLKTAELEMSAFAILIEGLKKDETFAYTEDYDMIPHQLNDVATILDLKKMEEARTAYVAAVAAAKECQDEESLAAAASARLYLQSFVLAA
ncbi:unnamed protein product [Rhodiola kirilowii]